jgi:glucokinase
MGYVLGMDLGGTKLSGVLMDDDVVIREAWVPHAIGDALSFGAALDTLDLALGIDDLPAKVDAVGLSFAGWLTADRETVILGANVGIHDLPLRAFLEERYGVPAAVENDGDATLLGEHALGAARGFDTCVLLTLGTGVGGGLLMNGRIFRGGRGLGGELGHMQIVTDNGAACVCGGTGCLETLVSGRALGDIAVQLGRDSPASLLADDPSGRATARELGIAASRGDEAAIEALQQAAAHLSTAIERLIPVIDPELIVLGGSVVDGVGDHVLPLIRFAVDERSFLRSFRPAPPVVPASLGGAAAAIGAAVAGRLHASTSTAASAPLGR